MLQNTHFEVIFPRIFLPIVISCGLRIKIILDYFYIKINLVPTGSLDRNISVVKNHCDCRLG